MQLADAEASMVASEQSLEEGTGASASAPDRGPDVLHVPRQEPDAAVSSAVVSDAGAKKKARRSLSKARVQLSHCLKCGSTEHRSPTCPLNQNSEVLQDADVRDAQARALNDNRKTAKLVSHLKYTQVDQRSAEYEGKPRKRARAAVQRSFLSLSRMGPYDLTKVLIQDGLLADLEGQDCPNPLCAQQGKALPSIPQNLVCRWEGGGSVLCHTAPVRQGYGDPKLGSLRSSSGEDMDIGKSAVFYRCGSCRRKYPVNLGNPLFEAAGGGSYGVSHALLAMWNYVEGIDLRHTVRQLNVNEKVVSRHRGGRAGQVSRTRLLFVGGSETDRGMSV